MTEEHRQEISEEEDVNTDHYKQRLLAQEQELVTRLSQVMANAREPDDEPAMDVGDQSASNERRDRQFGEADADATLLQQVREALGRIENGTFGVCLTDGESIEEKRLDAAPWSPYCLKHQELLEGPPPLQRATL